MMRHATPTASPRPRSARHSASRRAASCGGSVPARIGSNLENAGSNLGGFCPAAADQLLDALGDVACHARHRRDLLDASGSDATCRAKLAYERLLALGSNTRNIVEHGLEGACTADLAVIRY